MEQHTDSARNGRSPDGAPPALGRRRDLGRLQAENDVLADKLGRIGRVATGLARELAHARSDARKLRAENEALRAENGMLRDRSAANPPPREE